MIKAEIASRIRDITKYVIKHIDQYPYGGGTKETHIVLSNIVRQAESLVSELYQEEDLFGPDFKPVDE